MVKPIILIFANSDLRFDQRLIRISRSLSRHGYKPRLQGRTFPKSPALVEEPFFQDRVKLIFQKGKAAYLELNLRFLFHGLFQPTDAIVSVDLDTLPAAWLVSLLRNKPLIHDAHEYMEEVPEVYNRPITKAIWYWIGRLLLPRVKLAYTVSQTLTQLLQNRYGIPFHLVPNMAEQESEPISLDGWEGHKGYWVFLGAVNQGRGLEEFIPLLKEQERPLLVLGDGDKMEDIRNLVRELGLGSKVWLPGKLPPKEAASFLRHAWAGINLLRDEGLSYRYSLANKFFDYVHAGIPQICIRFPEYEARFNEFQPGVLCDLTPDSIKDAMDTISIPENQAFFRNQAQLASGVWNWETEETKLIQLYDALLRPEAKALGQ